MDFSYRMLSFVSCFRLTASVGFCQLRPHPFLNPHHSYLLSPFWQTCCYLKRKVQYFSSKTGDLLSCLNPSFTEPPSAPLTVGLHLQFLVICPSGLAESLPNQWKSEGEAVKKLPFFPFRCEQGRESLATRLWNDLFLWSLWFLEMGVWPEDQVESGLSVCQPLGCFGSSAPVLPQELRIRWIFPVEARCCAFCPLSRNLLTLLLLDGTVSGSLTS